MDYGSEFFLDIRAMPFVQTSAPRHRRRQVADGLGSRCLYTGSHPV